MWMDKRTEFADAIAVGTATGTAIIGDVIDLEDQRDIGSSANVWLVVQLQTAMVSAGAATLQLKLVSDAQAALATDGSATEHIVSSVMAYDSVAAGDVLLQAILPLERSGKPYERYLGIIGTIGTAALTAGKINAFLTLQPPVQKAYPDGAH